MNQAGRPGNLGGKGSVVARRRSGLGREVTNERGIGLLMVQYICWCFASFIVLMQREVDN